MGAGPRPEAASQAASAPEELRPGRLVQHARFRPGQFVQRQSQRIQNEIGFKHLAKARRTFRQVLFKTSRFVQREPVQTKEFRP